MRLTIRNLSNSLVNQLNKFQSESNRYFQKPNDNQQKKVCYMFYPLIQNLHREMENNKNHEGYAMLSEMALNTGLDAGCVKMLCPPRTPCSNVPFGISPTRRCICDASYMDEDHRGDMIFKSTAIQKKFS